MPMHLESWVKVGAALNVEITEEMILDLAGIPTPGIVPILNEAHNWALEVSEVRALKTKFYKEVKASNGKVRPIDAMVAVVHNSLNILPMAVGTGSSRSNALSALEDLNLSSYFKGVVAAEDTENPKPAPDVFLKCAEIIGIPPKDCLVFEDAPMGIQAAKAAGMMVVDVLEVVKKS